MSILKIIKNNNVQFYNLNKKINIRYLVVNRKQENILEKATKVLKDYMIKGYAVNQKKLEYLEINYKINQYSRKN
ncbi:MAG: virulence RhuM family protein [Bacilli bacterium]|nr:virulence RhuM family protein [Bacilli bacterium]